MKRRGMSDQRFGKSRAWIAARSRTAGFGFNINVLLGGQIRGQMHEIHYVYPQGNSLQASTASPFLQIGEFKYGKPILDRGFHYETKLPEAVKFGMLSMEATIKSNVSVGPPIDLFAYEKDSLNVRYRCRIEESDAYFLDIQTKWSGGIVKLVEAMPKLQFPGCHRAARRAGVMGGRQARVRVKICGITREEDALAAIRLGADALGFNLYPGSKRHILLEREAAWMQKLPAFVSRVAILVNVPLEKAREIAAHPAIDLVQFHGDEDEEYCAAFAAGGHPFIKALRLRDAASLRSAPRFSTKNVLVDADAGAAFGGTGTLMDFALAGECVKRSPELRVILAGGLNPGNVAEAVRSVRPFAVDVATGVESAPGIKDESRMAAFIGNATGPFDD